MKSNALLKFNNTLIFEAKFDNNVESWVEENHRAMTF